MLLFYVWSAMNNIYMFKLIQCNNW